MRYCDLHDMLRQDELIYIRFTAAHILDESGGPDDGMLARLTGIAKIPGEPGLLRLYFDLSEFVEHNKDVASHDWYDVHGQPTLTWFESGYYPENHKWQAVVCAKMDETVDCFEIHTPCNVCHGDEAVFWRDSHNNAFVSRTGKMLVTVDSHEIEFYVDRCPKCGKKLFNNDKGLFVNLCC